MVCGKTWKHKPWKSWWLTQWKETVLKPLLKVWIGKLTSTQVLVIHWRHTSKADIFMLWTCEVYVYNHTLMVHLTCFNRRTKQMFCRGLVYLDSSSSGFSFRNSKILFVLEHSCSGAKSSSSHWYKCCSWGITCWSTFNFTCPCNKQLASRCQTSSICVLNLTKTIIFNQIPLITNIFFLKV